MVVPQVVAEELVMAQVLKESKMVHLIVMVVVMPQPEMAEDLAPIQRVAVMEAMARKTLLEMLGLVRRPSRPMSSITRKWW